VKGWSASYLLLVKSMLKAKKFWFELVPIWLRIGPVAQFFFQLE